MQGVAEDILWASVSSETLFSVASLLKACSFEVTGKVRTLSYPPAINERFVLMRCDDLKHFEILGAV